MPSELTVEIAPGELPLIVESVFATMLNLEVDECPAPWFPGDDRLTSAVQMTGNWKGALLLECNRLQACQFAGRFLSMDPPDAVDDVVRDVLGELANMIGGNLKCVLASGVRISMPSVVDGSNYSVRICGAEVCEQLAFRSPEGSFWITVLVMR